MAARRCSHRPNSLTIKSQAPSAAASGKTAYAVLCTPTKTYQLRQVQTSNSLFVTRPTLDAHGNDIPVPTTRAVASCTATLELQPSADSPRPLLEHALPLYDIVHGDVDVAMHNIVKRQSVLQQRSRRVGGWLQLQRCRARGDSSRCWDGYVVAMGVQRGACHEQRI